MNNEPTVFSCMSKAVFHDTYTKLTFSNTKFLYKGLQEDVKLKKPEYNDLVKDKQKWVIIY